MDRAWAALRLGGAIVVDDIDVNRGFQSFTQSFSGYHSLICEAEPASADGLSCDPPVAVSVPLRPPKATSLVLYIEKIGPLDVICNSWTTGSGNAGPGCRPVTVSLPSAR